MAPRNSKLSKMVKADNVDEFAEEEKTDSFQEEVENELAFLQQFPVTDPGNKTRKEAEKVREIAIRRMRKAKRKYTGPPLDKEAEKARKDKIQKEFNRASARRSRVRRVANTRFLYWSNRMIEKMLVKSNGDLYRENFINTNIKKAIANAEEDRIKLRNQMETMTGNGNGIENPTSIVSNDEQQTTEVNEST